MSRWALVVSFISLLTAPIASGQPREPAFDVASVKLNRNCQVGIGRASISTRNLALPCMSLRGLIRLAYGGLDGGGLAARLVDVQGGPGWLDSERYDVLAKSEGNATAPSVAPMLQALLEDRFQVKVHKEPKDTSVYLLTVANSGLKLTPAKAGSCTPVDLTNLVPPLPSKPGEPLPRLCGLGGRRSNNGVLMVEDWYGVTMSEFAGRMLPGSAGRPVVDRTGLADRFDLHIEYVRDYSPSGPVSLNGAVTDLPQPAAGESGGPSIFSALEKQVGLKLSPGKAPLDVIIVDRAEKPSAN